MALVNGRLSLWVRLFALLSAVKIGIPNELRVDSNVTLPTDGICQSLDIRSNVGHFDKLRGCQVIEGNLHILLIENVNETHYANISFPQLTEITGYLLLFRVSGLRSLSALFPNLAVIRGLSTIHNYAFAVYEMSHLQDIGLKSLTHIGRGAVHIAKNPDLCFANTIDWDIITNKTENFIAQNKAENECPMCPGDEKDGAEVTNHSECPVNNQSRGNKGPQIGQHLCWNRNLCQKVCPLNCNGACNSKGMCCSELCMSGCSDNDINNCTVCRYLATGKKCAKECPINTVKFMDRRCVDEEDCRKIKKPKELDPSIPPFEHKPHEGVCLLDCPPNFSEKINKTTNKTDCDRCHGICAKICSSKKVDGIRTAQMLQGCTFIKGSLEIQIRGGGENMVKELDYFLRDITEIEGYLKVTRSYPLISLTFLRNLRVIQGKVLDNNQFSFIVFDNPNLEELLWDDNTTDSERKLKIENGRLNFHYNAKLCYNRIETLRIAAGLNESLPTEVSLVSNGEKTACNVTKLDVEVKPKNSETVVLSWNSFMLEEYRHLIGYIVYWTEAHRRNLSIYDSRDACGGDGWHVADVSPEAPGVSVTYYLLTNLKPYTQYAFYVKTYTVATEQTGAQSDIKYFRTLPGKPTSVLRLNTSSSESHIEISWLPPAKPNGNLTHYDVTVKLVPYNSETLEKRNYCKDPIKIESAIVHTSTKRPDTQLECPCPEKTTYPEIKLIEKDAILQINFENQLHNLVYVKRVPQNNPTSNSRTKRESAPLDKLHHDLLPTTLTPLIETGNDTGGPFVYTTNTTSYVVRNLHHYSEYTVSVKACRARRENDTIDDYCSDDSIINVRTSPRANADDIKTFHYNIPYSNETTGIVKLEWSEPLEPNGVIVSYNIEYKRVNIENSQPVVECITPKKFQEAGKTYTITNLQPGNYSFRVMASSLRGDGAYTSYRYIYIDQPNSNNLFVVVVGSLLGCLIVGLCVGGAVIYVRRNHLRGVPNMKLIASVNPEYVSTAYVPDDWEVPRKKIELLRELGQGSFGMVYEGVARDVVKGCPEMRCAIKTVNEHATDRERIEFLNEASVMKAFDTQHVVRLLGVVSQGQPTLVVMELMANGDLKSYLRSHRPEEQDVNNPRKESPPSLKRILQMAIEIADGMAYLTAKKFVHRDLAARNCMVSENLTVKIGDFGMTRDIYETDYYRKGTKGLLPVRWMAPESLKDGVFTSSSDVWSYGVVLWEMATLASQPYQGLSNDQVLRYVIDGGVMERPENCPDKLYDLMRRCWQHKSSTRPTFLCLATMLLPDASQEFRQGAFYFTKAGQEALVAQTTQQVEEAEATTPLRPAVDNDDDFSIDDSCSEHDELTDGETAAVVTESRYPAPYRTAAYRDAPPDPSLPAANGYVSGRPANNGVCNVKITEC